MTAAMPRTFLPGGGDRLGVPPLAVCREAQTDPLAAFSDQVGHCHNLASAPSREISDPRYVLCPGQCQVRSGPVTDL